MNIFAHFLLFQANLRLRFLFPFKLTASALELPLHFQYHVFNAMFHAVGSASARKRASVIKLPGQVQSLFSPSLPLVHCRPAVAPVSGLMCVPAAKWHWHAVIIYIYMAVVIAAANIVSSFSTSGPRPKLQQPAN